MHNLKFLKSNFLGIQYCSMRQTPDIVKKLICSHFNNISRFCNAKQALTSSIKVHKKSPSGGEVFVQKFFKFSMIFRIVYFIKKRCVFIASAFHESRVIISSVVHKGGVFKRKMEGLRRKQERFFLGF